jgi:peptide/nickel transport system substrate-binding protein
MARNFGFVVDPIGTVTTDFGPFEGRGGWGAMNWNSSSFNDAVKRYFTTFNKKEQQVLREKIVHILQEELPVIPIAWYDNFVVVNKRVTGVRLDPSEQRPYPEGVEWSE